MKEGRKPEYPEKPCDDELRKCHILKPENSCPNRDSNPYSSIGGWLGKQILCAAHKMFWGSSSRFLEYHLVLKKCCRVREPAIVENRIVEECIFGSRILKYWGQFLFSFCSRWHCSAWKGPYQFHFVFQQSPQGLLLKQCQCLVLGSRILK